MSTGTEEALLGGVEPRFEVDVSVAGTFYRSEGRESSVAELTATVGAAVAYTSSRTAIAIVTTLAVFLALVVMPLLLLFILPLSWHHWGSVMLVSHVPAACHFAKALQDMAQGAHRSRPLRQFPSWR